MEEIAIIVGTTAIGIAAGSIGLLFHSWRHSKSATSRNHELNAGQEEEVTQDSQLSLSPDAQSEVKTKIGRSDPSDRSNLQDYVDEKSGRRLIPKSQLEKSRRELKTLLLERGLASSALTRLYEAEAANEITKDERGILSAKYRGQLQVLDERIRKVDALVEIGDLETLKDQLLRFVSQKVDEIEKRLDRVKILAEPLIAELNGRSSSVPHAASPKSKVPDLSDLISTKPKRSDIEERDGTQPIGQVPPEQPALTESSPTGGQPPGELREAGQVPVTLTKVDGKVSPKSATSRESARAEELQREILEALQRLEKLDVES